MSRPDDTGADLNAARPGSVRPVHEPFTWVDEPDKGGAAAFAALTMDVCQGVHTCLQLIHSTDLCTNSGAGDEDPPILGAVDKERLLLLATAAMRMLGDRAKDRMESLNSRARKAARKEGGQ